MDYRERWELKEYRLGQRLLRRIRLVELGVGALGLAYLLGFWYLQGVQGDYYRELADHNRLKRVPVRATRGVIYDRHGAVMAAARPALRLLLHREGRSSEEIETQLHRLEGLVGLPYDGLRARLAARMPRPPFEPVALRDDLTLAQLAPLEARRELFPALEIQQVSARTYPEGKTAPHVLGYVGEISAEELAARREEGQPLELGAVVGKAGVERFYDERLRGRRGFKLVTVNNLGRELGEAGLGELPVAGQDLVLAVDLRLQRALLEAFAGESGAGVFLDPWNGEVLALVSSPGFDPDELAGGLSPEAWNAIVEDPRRPLLNRAISSAYAPGSTFKVVVAAAGLATGTVEPRQRTLCTGAAEIYGRRYACWKKGGHGSVDWHLALVNSCNVYFYHLGKALGLRELGRYAEMFGLGRPTGVDLPGEASGIVPSEQWKRQVRGEPWYPGETVSLAIGQGSIAVTPLQMARLMGVVATRGRLVRPHLALQEPPRFEEVPLPGWIFDRLHEALVDVVGQGTGAAAAVKGVRVAGKTGTAQVASLSPGSDQARLPKWKRDHAWFAGFAPAERPRVAFAVVVEHGGHGGRAAAPIVRHVLEAMFRDSPTGTRLGEGKREGLGDHARATAAR